MGALKIKTYAFASLEIADKFRFPHDDPSVVRSKISNRRYRTGSKVKTVRSIDARCYKLSGPELLQGWEKTHGTAATHNPAARDTDASVRAVSVGNIQGNQLMRDKQNPAYKKLTFEQKYKTVEYLKTNAKKLNGKRIKQLMAEIDNAIGVQINTPPILKELCTMAGVDWDHTRGGTQNFDAHRMRIRIAYEAIQALYVQLGVVPAPAFTKALEALSAGGQNGDDVDDEDDDE